MKKLAVISALILSSILSACSSPVMRDVSADFPTVKKFDAEKYTGKWYQLANYPQWFDRGCIGTTAEYAPISENEIEVVNSCYKGSFESEPTISKGKARLEEPGVLTVTFFKRYPKTPNYYVMAIKGNYEMAVVGAPEGKTAWILARKPMVSGGDYQWALGVLHKAGYDVQALVPTQHKEHQKSADAN